MATFVRRSPMPASAAELYAWHGRPGAFERLAPPWERIEVVERSGTIRDGDALELRLRRGPLTLRWRAVHEDHVAGEQFVDRQERGPFACWVHRHRFLAADGESLLEDRVEYRLPLDPVTRPLLGASVRRQLGRMFRFRHRRTHRDLLRHRGVPARRVGLTGAGTRVGRALTAFLGGGGHEVVELAPSPAGGAWTAGGADAATGVAVLDLETERAGIDPELAGKLDAVIHLDGAGSASPPDEDATRRTRRLSEGLARLGSPPECLLVLSSVAAYDPDRAGAVEEGDAAGRLPAARRWVGREAATATAAEAGIRVVRLRAGCVLGVSGGPLAGLVAAHRLGARTGGLVAPRTSWIGLDDLLGVCLWALGRRDVDGVVHAVAPEPVESGRVTAALRDALGRSAWLPLPGWLPGLLMGDTVSALQAARVRVLPRRLGEAGFRYLDPRIAGLLRFELGQPAGGADGAT